MTLIAAADGSALGNPGPAGWAWYIDADRWASGGWAHGTNNMGELTAVLELLRQTAPLDQDLLIYCDSQYVINSCTKWMPSWKRKGWRKGDGKPVLNVEIMQALDDAMRGRRVRFEWVKGHSGHPLNEEADRLANAAALAYSQGRQPVPGPGIAHHLPRSASPDSGDGPTSRPQPHAPTGLSMSRYNGPYPENDYADDLSSSDEPQPGSDESPLAVAHTDELVSASPESAVAEADLIVNDEPEATDEDRVVALERLLLADDVRADSSAVAALLHADWSEVGRSGRVWTRPEVLAEVRPLIRPVQLQVVSVSRVDAETILLVWRSLSDHGTSLRSSLWVRDDGDWRQRFHQGTTEG